MNMHVYIYRRTVSIYSFSNHEVSVSCRLITRAALIHLQQEYCSTEEQDYLDQGMEAAIDQAYGSAGVMVSVGKELMHCGRHELVTIMEKVHKCLPKAISKDEYCYSLLLLATFKVRLEFYIYYTIT